MGRPPSLNLKDMTPSHIYMFIGAGSWSTQEARAILAHWRGGRPDLATNSMGRILDPCAQRKPSNNYNLATTYCELHDNRPNVSIFLLFSGQLCELPLLRAIFNRIQSIIGDYYVRGIQPTEHVVTFLRFQTDRFTKTGSGRNVIAAKRWSDDELNLEE
jgi:hypothetical protein